jgi:hypothetical protein
MVRATYGLLRPLPVPEGSANQAHVRHESVIKTQDSVIKTQKSRR